MASIDFVILLGKVLGQNTAMADKMCKIFLLFSTHSGIDFFLANVTCIIIEKGIKDITCHH